MFDDFTISWFSLASVSRDATRDPTSAFLCPVGFVRVSCCEVPQQIEKRLTSLIYQAHMNHMKSFCLLSRFIAFLTLLIAPLSGVIRAATITLPIDAAAPTNSSTTQGFVVRSAQGPQTPPLANSVVRAIKQLNGTLGDASGTTVTNEALPNPL